MLKRFTQGDGDFTHQCENLIFLVAVVAFVIVTVFDYLRSIFNQYAFVW